MLTQSHRRTKLIFRPRRADCSLPARWDLLLGRIRSALSPGAGNNESQLKEEHSADPGRYRRPPPRPAPLRSAPPRPGPARPGPHRGLPPAGPAPSGRPDRGRTSSRGRRRVGRGGGGGGGGRGVGIRGRGRGRGRGGAARRRGEAVAAATRGSGGRCAVAVTHGSARALETRERASVLRPAPSSSSSSSSSSSQMRTQSKAAPFGTGRSAANSTTLAPVRRLACRRSPTDGSLGGTPPVRTRAVATGFLSATPLSTPASSRRVLAYRWRPLPAAPPALATRCPMPE